MTGAQIQATYFSPLMYFLYLFVIFAIMVTVYQFIWANKCNNFIRVLVVKPDGSTMTEYAPKSGGTVALPAPIGNTTRLWPINRLSAIEMLYPGDGFIPGFLQKKIKTVIVDEEDWEPLLNRGSYANNVASPDVIRTIRELADGLAGKNAQLAKTLQEYADGLSAAPTREMVASPAVLGNVMKEKVSEMAVTISKETFDKMAGIMERLSKLPNAMVLYIGLGLIIVAIIVLVVKFMPLGDVGTDVELIKKSLGIP